MANKQFLDKDGADYLVQGLKAKIPTKVSELTNDSGFKTTDNDTKNTAGSTDTSSKIFLIGATSQAANPQTYSHDTAYVGTDGCLYSNSKKVLTDHQSLSGLVPTTRTVNGKALSSDISLTASDVGALPSTTVIPTVNNATLTIQKNGTTVKTFTSNASDNVTANITVPTKVSELTNDSGFVTTDTTYTFATGDANGQIKVTPNDGVAQNISVKGLGSLAYSSATIPTKTSQLTNDSGFLTSHQSLANYVTLDGTQTISGQKTYSDVNKLLYATSSTANFTPNTAGIASAPWSKDLWHDHFAFLRYHSIDSQEKTEDGTTWTTDTKTLNNLFIEKENNAVQVLRTSEVGYRFTLKNSSFAYSGVSWFEISVAYTSPFSSFEVWIEHSADKETWSTCHKSTITGNSAPYFLRNGYSISTDGYTRFTFTKKSNLDTGTVNLACIKALCTRKGNQGLGVEFEFPYDWDSNANVLPISNNTKNLGSSDKKWANVYATTFNGNASSATTATTASGLKQQTTITTSDAADAFMGTEMKFAKIQNYTEASLKGNDGLIVSIPWSDKYGAQFVIDDTDPDMFLRTRNNGTWTTWKKIATISDIPDISTKQDKITSTNKLDYSLLSGTPTIPTITDTYSATSSNGMSGKAVASAISGKQNTLATQTAYSAKGSATKVPQITTNTLGQVTAITEVTITDNDTKNTAGSTDTSSKIYLVGATSQAANPQTYSDNEVFAENGKLTSKSFSLGGNVTIEYNSSDKCIEFNFS